jgi:4-amino-4-deoxy-L-arabinose transferase-like glycosyltransferase
MSENLVPLMPSGTDPDPRPRAREAARSPRTAAPRPEAAAEGSHLLLKVFLIGLGLRLAYVLVTRGYASPRDHFGFGWEMGRIARALASGRGFADPFRGETGPTAWVAPVFPLVMAGIFRVFGTYSALSGFLVLAFSSVCSCLTALVLFRMGSDLFGEVVGRRTAWFWALCPYTIYWPTRVVWDTSLTALLLSLVFWLTVRVGAESSARLWTAYGILWGLAAVTNPATLAFSVPAWSWAILRGKRRSGFRWSFVLGALLLAVLPAGAWMARNRVVLGRVVFIRDNFGEELRLGNGPGGHGEWMVWLHPTQSPEEYARYAAFGESRYVDLRGREAVQSILENLPLFAANSLRRASWFWLGTTKGESDDVLYALRNIGFAIGSVLAFAGLLLMRQRKQPEWLLFLALLALYPAVYYATFVVTRYRHPVEPELVLLIVFAVSCAEPRPLGATRGDLPVRALGRLSLRKEKELGA